MGEPGEYTFDRDYWEQHWQEKADRTAGPPQPVHPYLPVETSGLTPGTALDAGCGTGTEAIWLADQGWRVTGVDISSTALAHARARHDGIEWLEEDLSRWEPGRTWGLVVTNYAHPDSDQLEFYAHISRWVAPGGTLLIVAHRHDHGDHHGQPEHATAGAEAVPALFEAPEWRIESSYGATRVVRRGEADVELHDLVVRVRRSP